jgi:hypothetical protein
MHSKRHLHPSPTQFVLDNGDSLIAKTSGSSSQESINYRALVYTKKAVRKREDRPPCSAEGFCRPRCLYDALHAECVAHQRALH